MGGMSTFPLTDKINMPVILDACHNDDFYQRGCLGLIVTITELKNEPYLWRIDEVDKRAILVV